MQKLLAGVVADGDDAVPGDGETCVFQSGSSVKELLAFERDRFVFFVRNAGADL